MALSEEICPLGSPLQKRRMGLFWTEEVRTDSLAGKPVRYAASFPSLIATARLARSASASGHMRSWQRMGAESYPKARELLITADGGSSNGYKCKVWKLGLQDLADETGLRITVCHFPPGTSKWNKIEHRMFCHITMNWRGRPLISHEVTIQLIGSTSTKNGLTIDAALDDGAYPTGVEASENQLQAMRLRPASFHGEWNYTLLPKRKTA